MLQNAATSRPWRELLSLPFVCKSGSIGYLSGMKLPRGASGKNRGRGRGYLDGQMLIAMPAMNINFSDLLVKLDVIPAADIIRLPSRAGVVKVMRGGPVETERGFVLHSADFFIENSTLPIDDGICLTATLDILKAIARGDGPASAILALGYAGWAPGQLESEIQGNGWLHCAPDSDLIFGTDIGGKYDKALKKIGIDLGMLSSEAGHAGSE